MQLAGTLQAGETATVHLALTDISTTSADHASFSGGGDGGDRRAHRSELRCRHRHADLHRHRQPDGQPGDQPGCGQRQLGGRPRTIHGCADRSGQHDGAPCGRHRLGRPPPSPTPTRRPGRSAATPASIEGSTASYTVHLAGTLQAGETATVHLALTDISTTSADHASFTRGGDGGDRRAHRSELRCRHRHADLHRHRQPDGQPGDQPGCGQRQLGGRPRTIHGCADRSGQHDRRACGRHRLGDHHHHRHRHGDLVDQRRHRRDRGRHGELHGAPGRHAAGGRDGDGPSGAHRYQHHQR